jgi:hypothetical protein
MVNDVDINFANLDTAIGQCRKDKLSVCILPLKSIEPTHLIFQRMPRSKLIECVLERSFNSGQNDPRR